MKRIRSIGDQRTSAFDSIEKIAAPLSEFALLMGLSIADIEMVLRESVVRAAAKLQLEKSNRVNISGISASTGLSRTIVSRILKSSKRDRLVGVNRGQFTNRVLSAWHRDPKYADQNGVPATINVFGRGSTFESLVRRHGGGLPVRAILDELIRVDAIEMFPDQKIRARSSIAIARGLDNEMIESIGNRVSELLATMIGNLKSESTAKLVVSIGADCVSSESLGLIRKEVTNRGANLLSNIEETLFPNTSSKRRTRRRSESSARRVSVTIYYYDDEISQESNQSTSALRKNLKRKT